MKARVYIETSTVSSIVDELDRLRAEQMARFNFDFEAFYQNLKEQEKLLPQAVQPPPETPPRPRSGISGFIERRERR